MTFDQQGLRTDGFEGFIPLSNFMTVEARRIPTTPGVYAVLCDDDAMPTFLATSTGGWFKGKDPTLEIELLEKRWFTGCHVLYIGQSQDLRDRVKGLMRFGQGKAVGHWGGRCLWQLPNTGSLVVAWKRCDTHFAAKYLEYEMVDKIIGRFGKPPFANLSVPKVPNE